MLLRSDYLAQPNSDELSATDEGLAHWIAAIASQRVIAFTPAPPTHALVSALAINAPWRVLVPSRSPEHALKAIHLYSNTNTPALAADSPYHDLVGRSLEDDAIGRFTSTYLQDRFRITQEWLDTGLASRVQIEEIYRDPKRALCYLANTLGLTATQEATTQCISHLKRLRTGLATEHIRSLGPDRPVSIPPRQLPTVERYFEGWGTSDRNPTRPLFGARHPACIDDRFAEFQEFMSRHATSKHVFVVGFGKSGTTWLTRMFGQHPACVSTGERKLLVRAGRNPGLLSPLFDDQFFMDWFRQSTFGMNRPEGGDVRYDLARLLSDYLQCRAFQRRPWGPNLSDEQCPSHIVEKIALNQRDDALTLMRSIPRMYPGARFVHIVRDPRDVVVSGMFHRYRNLIEAGTYNWLVRYLDCCRTTGKRPDDEDSVRVAALASNIAQRWSSCVEIFLGNQSVEMTTVKYEDLITNVKLHLTTLFESAGLDNSLTIVEKAVEKTDFRSLSGGRERGTDDPLSHFRKGVAGDWRIYLHDQVANRIVNQAETVMRKVGYSDAPTSQEFP